MSNVQRILNLYKEGKISDSTLIKAAAFKKEVEKMLEDEGFEKGASFGTFLGKHPKTKLFLAALGTGSAFSLGAAGAAKAADAIEDIAEKPQKEKHFQDILAMRPELKKEDPLLVRKYFESLWKFAPAIASDPLAGGAYISQVIKFEGAGGPPYSTIEALVKTQKTYKDTNPAKGRFSTAIAGSNFSTPDFK